MLYTGADSAYPTIKVPDVDIIAGYIGGPDCLHTWSPEEWRPFAAKRQLPIWVDSHASYANGRLSGEAAVNAALKLGWAAGVAGDARRWIAVDSEINSNFAYYNACATAIWDAGFRMLHYCAEAGMLRYEPTALVWLAMPGQPKPETMIYGGYQYAWNVNGWDLDVFSASVYNGCGRGARAV